VKMKERGKRERRGGRERKIVRAAM